MKKVIVYLILAISINAAQFKHELGDFINMAAQQNDVRILISESVDKSAFKFYTKEKEPKISIDMLKQMLKSNSLVLLKFDDFYFVDTDNSKDEIIDLISNKNRLYSISLKNHTSSDVTNLLKMLDVNSTFISNTNEVYFSAPDDAVYESIKLALANIDKSPKQAQIKITILDTNLAKVKTRGSQISSYLKSAPTNTYNYFLNLITMPFNATSNVTNSSKGGFYEVLKYLNENDFTKIEANPIFLLRSGKELYFSSAQNIPYLTQNKAFKDDKESVTNSYEYKDVGLKVKINPLILDNGSIDLDIDLIMENIISTQNDKPTTSKKQLKGSYLLKRGELLILSGLNQNLEYNKDYSVPLLSNIWILGELFKYRSKEIKSTNLTLSIEIL